MEFYLQICSFQKNQYAKRVDEKINRIINKNRKITYNV